ncbi:hypothetical protein ABL78_2764 [Leptomonas seymouri]|uniref:ATP synthase regulation protein NCA2 n=1 Tax=Leptomonas seymouri TaxID=5684 RepID=A0A0N1I755_LEPSE|nr:hypothetical protein ABL78_2764 [Leptomonas seymouri]|eukprot:KPI88131.1 hypothetical protein ABL78_2764 [Leptomonas seymouri]
MQMPYSDVDVRTPIFYRHNFASALEEQSRKAYARFTHMPVVAEHLPRGAASAARVAEYGANRLRSLGDLEKVLRTILGDLGPKAGARSFSCSLRGPGMEEVDGTVTSPSFFVSVQSPHTLTSQREDECDAQCASAPAYDLLAAGAITGNGDSGGPPRSSPKKAVRPVSFPAGSCNATLRIRRNAVGDQRPSESKAARLWRWMREWVWRGVNPSAPASPSIVRHQEESGMYGVDGAGAGFHRCESTAGATAPRAHLPTQPPVQNASSLGVPTWVRTAFTPAAAAAAAATVDNTHPCSSRVPRDAPTQAACTASAEQSMRLTRTDTVPVDESGSEFYSAPLSGAVGAAAGHTSPSTTSSGNAGDRRRGMDPLRTGDTEEINSQWTYSPRSTQEPSPPPSNAGAASSSRRCSAEKRAAQDGSEDKALEDSGHEKAPAGGSFPSSPPSGASTHANVSVAEDHASAFHGEGQWRQTNRSELPAPVASAVVVGAVVHSSEAEPYSEDNRVRAGGASALSLPHSDTPSVALNTNTPPMVPQSTTSASSSPTGCHEAWQGGAAPSCSTAATGVLERWDRRVYAVELVGWLHLLVWVRCEVIHFLRDLSGVQGFVAWSAWYWSWAQDHPRQASLHQALSSRRFWRGVLARGFTEQLSQVQYETSEHMFTLNNAFHLIVSYIGAVYTSLDQLNSAILQIQHHCEMTTSPVAAAAAAAAARSCVAGLGAGGGGKGGGIAGFTSVPELSMSISRGAYTVGRRGILSNQNSDFRSFAPAAAEADDFSSFAPRTRCGLDMHADPAVGPQSASRPGFEDACAQDSAKDSEMADAAEEVEAVAALHVLDKLRQAVWSMLQEQRSMFRSSGQQPDALELDDFFGRPDGLMHADGHSFGNASVTHASGGAPVNVESVFNTATAGEVHLGGASMRLQDDTWRPAEDKDGERPVTARDGAAVLLQCVQQSQRLLLRLKLLVQRAHSPPASRHWQRIVVAAATTIPPFVWLYRKSPAELMEIARGRYRLAQQIVKSYLLDPIAQLKESFFYVRPGVEDRRGAFECDAMSLANIVRDFHEDMYPNMPQDRLDQMRDRTLGRLVAGVADPEGMGLIDQQYRCSLRHPIRSVIFGELPRILLVQLSYQALEMSRVANSVDEVLVGNDLNFKIMALLPVFAAGGLLVSWGLLRHRANYKPVRMRMKLLWRSLFRVICFAGNGQRVLPPFMRGLPQRAEVGVRLSDSVHFAQRPFAAGRANTERSALNNSTHRLRHGGAKRDSHSTAAAAAAVGVATACALRRTEAGHVEVADPVSFAESSEDDNNSLAASVNTHEGAVSARQLNNYEQGMVLLLSHVIRSLAAEYLRSYEYFHELLEDLNDLESVQSSRHQRLATLERMRATHTSLF